MRIFTQFKSLMLVAAAFCCSAMAFAETQTIYSWESPEGTAIETGGTIVSVNGVDDRVNYGNANYYTVCLSGKYANMNDAEASKNAAHIVLTLNEALQEGDIITMTGYRNKNADGKNATIYFLFENGQEWLDEKTWVNILSDDANPDYDNDGSTPNTNTWTITAAEAGCKVIKMSRNAASTNIFLTKITITREGSSGIESAIEEGRVVADRQIYTIAGNRVSSLVPGLNIVKTRYANGTSETKKVYFRQ